MSEQEKAKHIARFAGLKRGDVVGDFVVVDDRGNVRRRDTPTTKHEADPFPKAGPQ